MNYDDLVESAKKFLGSPAGLGSALVVVFGGTMAFLTMAEREPEPALINSAAALADLPSWHPKSPARNPESAAIVAAAKARNSVPVAQPARAPEKIEADQPANRVADKADFPGRDLDVPSGGPGASGPIFAGSPLGGMPKGGSAASAGAAAGSEPSMPVYGAAAPPVAGGQGRQSLRDRLRGAFASRTAPSRGLAARGAPGSAAGRAIGGGGSMGGEGGGSSSGGSRTSTSGDSRLATTNTMGGEGGGAGIGGSGGGTGGGGAGDGEGGGGGPSSGGGGGGGDDQNAGGDPVDDDPATPAEKKQLKQSEIKTAAVAAQVRSGVTLPSLRAVRREALQRSKAVKRAAKDIDSAAGRYNGDLQYYSGAYADVEFAQTNGKGYVSLGQGGGLSDVADQASAQLDGAAACVKEIEKLRAEPEDDQPVLDCFAAFDRGLQIFESLKQALVDADEAVEEGQGAIINALAQREQDPQRSEEQRAKDKQARDHSKQTQEFLNKKLRAARSDLRAVSWKSIDRMQAKMLAGKAGGQGKLLARLLKYLDKRDEKMGPSSVDENGEKTRLVPVNAALRHIEASRDHWKLLSGVKDNGNPTDLGPAALNALQASWELDEEQEILAQERGGKRVKKPKGGWSPLYLTGL